MIYNNTEGIKVIHGDTEEIVDYINKNDCPVQGDYIQTPSGIYIVDDVLYDFVNKIMVLYCTENDDFLLNYTKGSTEQIPERITLKDIHNFIYSQVNETPVKSKLEIVKEVMQKFNLGLKEAKDHVDAFM